MLDEHVTAPEAEDLAARIRASLVSVSEVVEEVEVEAAIDAHAGGFGLAVAPVERGVYVEADPEILAAAVTKLVHNAFKHSRSHGHVSLTATAVGDHVLIEVEDECGGLSPGEAEELLRPFEDEGVARPPAGFGVSLSRRGVAEMGGQLRVRNLPGKGCVFTVDLPRQMPPDD
jgi:signal transduction histidine kinase